MTDHLSDEKTYKYLTPAQAQMYKSKIIKLIRKWIRKYKKDITEMERRFLLSSLEDNKDPFPAFYLLAKVHKTPWKTRPIVSCAGSLLHPLGVWVAHYLHDIAKAMPTYLADSRQLKEDLIKLNVPPGAKIFTADATSMYTNLKTEVALNALGKYITENSAQFRHLPLKALKIALTIIMTYNVFTFGDAHFLQLTGAGMGTPPAPDYAQATFGTHEVFMLARFLTSLLLYKRYIDDICGVWVPKTDAAQEDTEWRAFTMLLNMWFGLEWKIIESNKSADFMDLTITLKNGKIQTTLFEKSLNLYLYIPPHSAHPPGVLNGIIFGQIHRIFTLCSERADIKTSVNQFLVRLLQRGYQRPTVLPIFYKAIHHNSPTMIAKRALQQEGILQDSDRKQVYLHMKYHPNNAPSYKFQQAWRKKMGNPKFRRPLTSLRNRMGFPIEIERMVVAYSRPLNLGNILSYRRVNAHINPPA